MNNKEKQFLLCIIILFITLIGLFSVNRNFFTFGTETDYLGGFVPEAQRLMRGEPLLLEFHPPLYSMVLALVQTLTQDWLRTGLFISIVSSIIALITSFLFFYSLLGTYAGWGAILGLISSSVFIHYSVLATSDLFFLALYNSVLLLSLLAIKKKSTHLWIICGLVVGCTILTRTNGITCLIIGALPWVNKGSFKQKLVNFIYFISGLFIPLIAWFSFALSSGSQLTPSGNYLNFALTYFSPSSDRISNDARVQVEAKFDNLFEVLSYQPIHIVQRYIKDLILLCKNLFQQLNFPLNLFLPVGIFALYRAKVAKQKKYIFYIIMTLLQVLLLNFKAYEDRYFLFLIPIFGAIVGEAFRFLIPLAQRRQTQRFIVGFCLLCSLLALSGSYFKAWSSFQAHQGYLEEVIPKITNLKLGESVMIARKPHMAFYTQSQGIAFPDVETWEELRNYLEIQSSLGNVFLYYGYAERKFRPQFVTLGNPQTSPSWLEIVEQSSIPGLWALYRYNFD